MIMLKFFACRKFRFMPIVYEGFFFHLSASTDFHIMTSGIAFFAGIADLLRIFPHIIVIMALFDRKPETGESRRTDGHPACAPESIRTIT